MDLPPGAESKLVIKGGQAVNLAGRKGEVCSDPVDRLLGNIPEGILNSLQDGYQRISFHTGVALKDFLQFVHLIHNSGKYIEYVCYSANNTIIYYLYPIPDRWQ